MAVAATPRSILLLALVGKRSQRSGEGTAVAAAMAEEAAEALVTGMGEGVLEVAAAVVGVAVSVGEDTMAVDFIEFAGGWTHRARINKT